MFLGEYSKAEPSSKPNISKKALLQKPSKDQNFHIELVQDQRVFWNPPFLYYSEISFARESEIGFSQFSHSLRHIKPNKKNTKISTNRRLVTCYSSILLLFLQRIQTTTSTRTAKKFGLGWCHAYMIEPLLQVIFVVGRN